ncbi:hypothetical protein [uncultured Campylobacter sp.]|uniref:hypothetical protein n=1 Tax=uncultured Campylobacter sp. TaxID=218934 RepID=UPI002620B97F|nr:hypothetical protein [uncultured Campylobacter sp.]
MLIYCALNAAFALLGLALCGAGFFGSGSFGVRALAWLLSLEAGFLGAFGAVYFSFRAYRNKIEDELRAGKYDEILQQRSKNSVNFMSDENSACNTNSASCGDENRGDASGSDKILYSEVCGGKILKSENFSGANSGAEISNSQNFEDAINFTSDEARVENGDSRALHDETAAERAANSAAYEDTENFAAEYSITAARKHDVNFTKSGDDKTSACNATALEDAVANKFSMKDSETCGDLQSGKDGETSDSSQSDIGERYDDLKSGANGDLGDGTDSGDWSDGADRSDRSDGADSGNRRGDVDSGEPDDSMSDFGGGIGTARDGSKDDFEGADDFEGELERSEVRSNFAGAFFSPFKILSYAALVAAIYLLAKLSLLNPLAIILGVAIIPLGTMIAAFGGKDAH